jgi:hypothetical protein
VISGPALPGMSSRGEAARLDRASADALVVESIGADLWSSDR